MLIADRKLVRLWERNQSTSRSLTKPAFHMLERTRSDVLFRLFFYQPNASDVESYRKACHRSHSPDERDDTSPGLNNAGHTSDQRGCSGSHGREHLLRSDVRYPSHLMKSNHLEIVGTLDH